MLKQFFTLNSIDKPAKRKCAGKFKELLTVSADPGRSIKAGSEMVLPFIL